jgi:hypothetical protein
MSRMIARTYGILSGPNSQSHLAGRLRTKTLAAISTTLPDGQLQIFFFRSCIAAATGSTLPLQCGETRG